MHFEQLFGDGLVDEVLRLRNVASRPYAHQVCWYHPGLWPRLSSVPDTTWPRFVPGCVAYRSTLQPPASSTATS